MRAEYFSLLHANQSFSLEKLIKKFIDLCKKESATTGKQGGAGGAIFSTLLASSSTSHSICL